MKFYSDLTKNLYDTEADLQAAETEFYAKEEEKKKVKEERALAAKEVEKAFKDADKAKEDAMNKLKEFCKTYGSFRTSIDSETLNEIKPSVFSSIFDLFNF